MSLFRCPKCGVIENTALAHLGRQVPAHIANRHVCSQCLTGEWHGEFEQEYIPTGVCPECRLLLRRHSPACEARRVGYREPRL